MDNFLKQKKIIVGNDYATPFLNSVGVFQSAVNFPRGRNGKSYFEILKLLEFAGRQDLCARVYRGSENYHR